MKISNNGYNVADIVIDTPLTAGTETEVGTEQDFVKIAGIADAGGVARIHASLGGNAMNGVMFITHTGNYIDLGCVTNFGGSPSVIAGTVELKTNHKMYVTVTMTAVTAASRTAVKKS